jgi:DNA-binding Lrp family transcriptional regulator
MLSRLPRFKRAPSIPPMELTERDRQIISLVHQHRFLRSNQIAALLSGSPQQVLRRLTLLYQNGFLERPRAQLEYFHQGGSRHLAYGLGNKSEGLLKEEAGFRKLDWNEKNRGVKRIFLDHALLVSEIMVSIELACRRSGQVRLLSGPELPVRNGQPFRWRVNMENGVNLGIVPDRVFALERESERAFFFLEADRGTMPVIRKSLSQTSFYRKLLAYSATWSQGIHRSRFGFHRFRVLTVTTSAERVNSLLDACSQLQHGHGLFLFADRTILDSPDILSASWQSGKAGKTGTLLD